MRASRLNSKLSKFLLRIEPEESAKKEVKIREEILSLRPKRKIKKPEVLEQRLSEPKHLNETIELTPSKPEVASEEMKEKNLGKEPQK